MVSACCYWNSYGGMVRVETTHLGCRDLDLAAEPVDDERGQGLAVDVLGDDEQRVALQSATG